MGIAEEARDEGIRRVTKPNEEWMAEGIHKLSQLSGSGVEWTGEDMRMWLREAGLSEPTHHNAWGALIKKAVSKQLIADTGHTRNLKTEKSHARRSPIWRF